MSNTTKTHELVKDAYGKIANQANSKESDGNGCGCGCGPQVSDHPVPDSELGLSCGDPVTFSEIQTGDIVLDLGSGAGKDVFLSATKTGPTGRVIGVDMTTEMIDLANRNIEKFKNTSSQDNVEFRLGYIEELPLDDNSVDLVISNCVINLAVDKPKVFSEIYRVLKPGGRFVVSDIVLKRALPEEIKEKAEMYTGCVSGALKQEEYLDAISSGGFETIEILKEHIYDVSAYASDEIKEGFTEDLSDLVASVTVKGVK